MLLLVLFTISQISLLSRSAFATPLLSIPLTKVGIRTATSRGSYDTTSTLKHRALSNVSVTNLGFLQYVVDVGVGHPPTYYSLLIDTGSSITFVGAGKPYNQTSTSIATGQNLEVTSNLGYLAGPEYYDTITLSPDIIITNQSIGNVLTRTASLESGVDGILGVGPVDLTVGSLSQNITSLVPTVMDNAQKQGLIQQQIMSVSFAPASTFNETNGIVTFGGIDSSLFIDNITYVPITSTYPAGFSWGINITSCTYGGKPIFQNSTAGIVDTGTSLVTLADDFFAIYMAAIPGSYYDNTTGFFFIPSPSVRNMQPLNFTIGGTVFTMDVAAQIIPFPQGPNPSMQYGSVGPSGHPSGQGSDFILGQKFLEKYYAVFDGQNKRVGLAYTHNSTSPPPVIPVISGALPNTSRFRLLAILSMIAQAALQFIP